MKKEFTYSQKGFTLIELLIVIAIIGILASVLIAVINPAKQQAKAKDAVIKSTMAKIGLTVNTYYGGYSNYPTCAQLANEFNSGTVGAISGTDPSCVIAASGSTGGQTGKYSGGTGSISFPALGTGTTGQFWLWTPTGGEITLGTVEAY